MCLLVMGNIELWWICICLLIVISYCDMINCVVFKFDVGCLLFVFNLFDVIKEKEEEIF